MKKTYLGKIQSISLIFFLLFHLAQIIVLFRYTIHILNIFPIIIHIIVEIILIYFFYSTIVLYKINNSKLIINGFKGRKSYDLTLLENVYKTDNIKSVLRGKKGNITFFYGTSNNKSGLILIFHQQGEKMYLGITPMKPDEVMYTLTNISNIIKK
jgi:hypothetical protein